METSAAYRQGFHTFLNELTEESRVPPVFVDHKRELTAIQTARRELAARRGKREDAITSVIRRRRVRQ
jgi:hypothetical protein